MDNSDEITIRRIFIRDLPDAVTVDMIRQAAERDPVYSDLIAAVKSGHKPADRRFVPYTSVWAELGVVDGLICRGERIVVPDSEVTGGDGNIREWVTEIAHEGHHGMVNMKRYLRERLWWPGLDKLVERRSASCEACQASTLEHRRDPLQPSTAPSKPWVKVAADHWGPTPNHSVLVMVDHLTKYPEVEVVKGTSAHDNILAMDNIFSRHGFPAVLHTDNGAPFNGGRRHELQEYFKWAGIEHKPNKSPYDPEANGLAESFMKHVKKIWHTATLEQKDPTLEINKHLRVQRATPHPSTGVAPAELLYGRLYKTRLPDMRTDPASSRPDILQARERDKQAKMKQKEYKDAKTNVKPHSIQEGDKVLLGRKQTKLKSPYDPAPYTVIQVHGTQIVARRGEQQKTRDSQYWKKVDTVPRRDFTAIRQRGFRRDDDYLPDIGPPAAGQASQPQAFPGSTPPAPLVHHGAPRAPARQTVREQWSFQAPHTWAPQAQPRPLTRSVSARRQADRARVRGGDRGEAGTRRGNMRDRS